MSDIRKNAPKGATHYDHEVKKYFRLNGDVLSVWMGIWTVIPIIFLDIERCTVL